MVIGFWTGRWSYLPYCYSVKGRSPSIGETWAVPHGNRVLFVWSFCCAFILQRYRDTLLRHGGERRPQEMLSRLLNEGEATADTGHLAAGLCEDIAIREESARVVLTRMGNPSWNLVQ